MTTDKSASTPDPAGDKKPTYGRGPGGESLKLRRVLLATDFSKAGEGAAGWALELCRRAHAELVLAHCVDGLVDSVFYFDDPTAEAHANATRSAKEHLALYSKRFANLHHVSRRLVEGVPWRGIVDLAGELELDLVIVGTRGLHGIDRLLLGSTARAVIQHCPCPVLTVPAVAGAPAEKERLHALFATDFSSGSDNAITAALELLPPFERLTVLSVYASPYLEVPYAAMPTKTDLLQSAREASDAQLTEIATNLHERLEGATQVHTASVEGFPPQAIVEFAERIGAEGDPVDLLVLGTHGRSGLGHLVLGSVAERTVQNAHCPVLTVRGKH
jgi:nucleotide-binding universal stress UspA family protein